MWQVCLLVKYNIKVKYVCVCLSLSVWACVCRCWWRNWYQTYLWNTCWHHEFDMTVSTFSWKTTMIRILRDFKPILDLDLYTEHMPEERITGSKIDLDLSASTYIWVYMVVLGEWTIWAEANTVENSYSFSTITWTPGYIAELNIFEMIANRWTLMTECQTGRDQ